MSEYVFTKNHNQTLSEVFKQTIKNPYDFELITNEDLIKLKYKYGAYSFLIKRASHSEYTMGIASVGRKGETYSGSPSWEDTLGVFKGWLRELNHELYTQSGWEFLNRGENIFDNIWDEDTEFTKVEKDLLLKAINEIKVGMTELALMPKEIEKISLKLDSIAQAADKLNKPLWKDLFYGGINNLAFHLVLAPDTQGALWNLIVKAFIVTIRLGS